MAVAILAPGTPSGDARDAVYALLTAEGIPALGANASDPQRLLLFANAFMQGGITADEFGSQWWSQLPSADLQTDEQARVTRALDAWQSETDTAARTTLAGTLREQVALWLKATDRP